jgi:hypothetical protein
MMTPEEVEARFQRIEASLERAGQRIEQITETHLELENAQLNGQKAHNKLAAMVEDLAEKIGNLAFSVDRLIERDLGGA